MKEYIAEHKGLAIGVGLGVLGVALGSYIFMKKRYVPQEDQSYTPLEKPLDFHQKFSKVVREIRKMLDESQETLTPEILMAIYRGHYYLANEQGKAIILKSRQERREKLQSKIDYSMIVLNYEKKLQQLLDRHLSGILAQFSIDKQIWIDETGRWSTSSEQAYEEWEDLIKQEEDKLIASLKPSNARPKNFETIKAILQYKIKNLQVLTVDDFSLDLAGDETGKFNIVDYYIKDLVYGKFRVEDELLEYSVQQLSKEQKQQLEGSYDRISELMGKFIMDGDLEGDGEEDFEQEGFF